MSSTIEASFYLKNIENMFHGIINYSGLQNTRIHENLAFLNWLQQQDFHSSLGCQFFDCDIRLDGSLNCGGIKFFSNEGITVNNTCSLAIIKYWLTVVVVQEIDSMKNTIDQKFEYLTNDKLTSSLMSLWHKLRGCGVSIEAFQGYDDGSIRNACRTKAFDSYSKAQHFKLCMDIRLSWGVFFLLQALSSNICCKLESFRNSLDIDYPPMKEILRDCWTVFRYKTDLMRSLIERAQNGLLQILAGWKWQSRFYSEESQFPSEFKENLRDIHAGIKNILEVHRIFLSVNQEVMNLLSQLNNKDVLEELDICHRNLQYITSLHDQLIMRFLANEKCSIIQPIKTTYDGFETRNHEKTFSAIEMTLEQLGDRQYCIGKFKERFTSGKRDKNAEELPYVTDYRCQLIFSCNVQTCLGTTLAMECKSKPFALLTGGNQLARADTGVAWDIHLIPDTDVR
ncbi:hypothetical protein TrispH2_005668 [Trichoplax sp. H2]|nr:hypothetical protein TrispH2_005668 [Trichoplax sp. H2]|eukprot:RDD41581.1 hypothetical protein TrispH2_005668 [Trichoplax sp. H2]